MASRELEVSVDALSFQMTVVIQRLYVSDPVWTREFLESIRTDQMAASKYGEQSGLAAEIFRKAIHIVEEALALDPSARSGASSSAGAPDGR